MSEIGELLREQRIKKGLSIDDIQEITKIRSRYIQAIEDGNLDKLPGQFYAKAFIKSYAEVVGLDREILEQYQGSIPKPELENVTVTPRYTSMNNRSSRIGKWLVVSLIYILIGLILLFAYMFIVSYNSDNGKDIVGDPFKESRIDVDDEHPPSYDKDDNNDKDNEADKSDSTTQPNNPADEIQIVKESTTTYKNRPNDTYVVSASKDNPVTVQLKFTDRCWFDIREGGPNGKQILTSTYEPGQQTTLMILEGTLWIHLGRASAADIYIDNKMFKAGSDTSPKYISIEKKELANQ